LTPPQTPINLKVSAGFGTEFFFDQRAGEGNGLESNCGSGPLCGYVFFFGERSGRAF
jgi:hypothetical protein